MARALLAGTLLWHVIDAIASGRHMLLSALLLSIPWGVTSAQSHLAVDSAAPATDRKKSNAIATHVELPDMFATLSLAQHDAFVSEQVNLQLEILTPTIAFNIRRPKLLIDNAEIYGLRKSTGRVERNNQTYDQQRFDYAIFFKKPGTYQLPALKVTATLPVAAGGASSTSNPVISAQTTAHNLTISDAPVTASQWLPAASLELKSTLTSQSPPTAGQPIPFEYHVAITGQHPAAIPAISYPELTWARQYTSPPAVKLQADADGVRGILMQTVNVIPERSGEFTVPPVTISWWDINSKEWQQAVLSEKPVVVQPASVTSNVRSSMRSRWLTLLFMCTTLLFAVTSLWLLLRLRNQTQPLPATAKATERQAWRALQRALKQRRAKQVRQTLLNWYSVAEPSAINPRLEQLAEKHGGLGPHLQQLDESIYRTANGTGRDDSAPEPDYPAIANAVTALRKLTRRQTRKHSAINRKAPTGTADNSIEKLYPGSR
jgi:hypothetical protein